MSRTVQARLQLEISDDQLDPHVTRVREARTAWAALGAEFDAVMGGGLPALAGVFASFAKPLKDIAEATKAGGMRKFTEAVTDLASPLNTVVTRMAPFAQAAADASPHIAKLAVDTGAWSKSMQTLSAVMNTLTNRMQSLSTAQQKADQNQTNFGLGLIAANKLLKDQGQEMLRVLQAYSGFNRSVAQSTKVIKEKEGALKRAWAAFVRFERGYIRHSTALFIAENQLTSFIDALKDAAAQADLTMVLGRDLEGFQAKMEGARKSTMGMVSDLQILKSAALMSSFGIPMENFASNLEVVQKLAIRTGQSTEYLMDSFSRGISRLSPAILDNLGLQIKLSSAFEAYAASVGKATDALTAQEKKQAVMAEVLRQGMDLTKDVDPMATLSARLEQSRAKITNFFADIKIGLLDVLAKFSASTAESAATATAYFAVWKKEIAELGKVTETTSEQTAEWLFSMDMSSQLLFQQFGRLSQGWEVFNKVYDKFLASQDDDSIRLTANEVEVLADAVERFSRVSRLDPRLQGLREMFQSTFNNTRVGGFEENVVEVYRKMGGEIERVMQENILFEKSWGDIEKAMNEAKGVAEKMFPGSSSAQAAFISEISKEMKALKEEMLAFVEASPFAGDNEEFDMAAIGERIAAAFQNSAEAVKKTSEESFKANAAVRERLTLMDKELLQLQAMVGEGKGITEQEVNLVLLRKEATKALAEHNKIMEDQIALGKEGAVATADQARASLDKVAALLKIQASLEAAVKHEKDFATAMKDTVGLSKALRETEAERLAGGRSRLELEKEYLEVVRDHAIATDELAMAKANVASAILAMNFAGAAQGLEAIAEAQRKVLEVEEKGKKNWENRKRFGSAGGGKGTKDKDKGNDGTFFAEEVITGMQSVATEQGIILTVMRDKFETYYDSVTGKATKYWLETTKAQDVFFKASTAMEDKGFGLWTGMTLESAGKAIQHNEKLLKQLEEHEEIFGALDPVMSKHKQDLIDTLLLQKEYIESTDKLADKFRDLGAAIGNAFAGGQDIIGSDFLNMMDGLADSATKMAAALGSEAEGYNLIIGAMPGVRAFTKELIDSRRKQATIEMLMNAAAAWAAYPNIPQMVAHGTAALIYGLVSAGAVPLPTKASKTDKDSSERAAKTSSPINVHIYGTEMILSEGQMGRRIEDGVQQARAEGRI